MTHQVLTNIRARVREAVARAALPGHAATHPGRFAWASHDAATTDERVARFTSEIEPLGGKVHRVASVEAAREAVVSLALDAGAAGVLAWPDEEIGVPGLTETLRGRGLRFVDQAVGPDESRQPQMDALGECGVGITGADFGLADTGSLVLVSGPGRGRLASLLPPVHVAVLPVSRLVWTLADVLAISPDLPARGSNFVVITGPSRTADIEMTLTRGVHGPRDVHVVLVG